MTDSFSAEIAYYKDTQFTIACFKDPYGIILLRTFTS